MAFENNEKVQFIYPFIYVDDAIDICMCKYVFMMMLLMMISMLIEGRRITILPNAMNLILLEFVDIEMIYAEFLTMEQRRRLNDILADWVDTVQSLNAVELARFLKNVKFLVIDPSRIFGTLVYRWNEVVPLGQVFSTPSVADIVSILSGRNSVLPNHQSVVQWTLSQLPHLRPTLREMGTILISLSTWRIDQPSEVVQWTLNQLDRLNSNLKIVLPVFEQMSLWDILSPYHKNRVMSRTITALLELEELDCSVHALVFKFSQWHLSTSQKRRLIDWALKSLQITKAHPRAIVEILHALNQWQDVCPDLIRSTAQLAVDILHKQKVEEEDMKKMMQAISNLKLNKADTCSIVDWIITHVTDGAITNSPGTIAVILDGLADRDLSVTQLSRIQSWARAQIETMKETAIEYVSKYIRFFSTVSGLQDESFVRQLFYLVQISSIQQAYRGEALGVSIARTLQSLADIQLDSQDVQKEYAPMIRSWMQDKVVHHLISLLFPVADKFALCNGIRFWGVWRTVSFQPLLDHCEYLKNHFANKGVEPRVCKNEIKKSFLNSVRLKGYIVLESIPQYSLFGFVLEWRLNVWNGRKQKRVLIAMECYSNEDRVRPDLVRDYILKKHGLIALVKVLPGDWTEADGFSDSVTNRLNQILD